MSASLNTALPCLSFNHGDGSGSAVSDFLIDYGRSLPRKPNGIIVLEAHLRGYGNGIETPMAIVGDKDLVSVVSGHLQSCNIQSRTIHNTALQGAHGLVDARRAFPGIPVVALSVLNNEASAHASFVLGEALAPLRKKHGMLILGSGLPTFHNFGLLKPGMKQQRVRHGLAFGTWLSRALATENREERLRMLASWRSAPSARECHPAGDTHFVPTLVLAAAGDTAGRSVHEDSHRKILAMAIREGAKLHHFEFK